jgi:hypothetical protein
MKFFTFYSDSHKHLLDLFLKSFFKNCNLDLIVRKIEQKCSGDYHSNGWQESMINKIQYIIDSLNQCNDGEIMIHSDCDILICSDIDNYIKESLDNNDISFQWDSTGVCMGFFACVKNDITIDFFNKLLSNLCFHIDDQHCANSLLNSIEFSSLKWKLFDLRTYTIGMENKMYSQKESFNIPSNMKIFHANFTLNLKDKTDLMNSVFNFLEEKENLLIPYPPKYATYPPYSNVKDYIEHSFFDFYHTNIKNFNLKEREYIPAFWTTLYNDNHKIDIQFILDSLPKDKKYFTVIQHDDGVKYNLPPDTLVFSCTENGNGKIIPIPLITTELNIENKYQNKDILCSFVGSMTHPIRHKIYNLFKNNNNFLFSIKSWNPLISENEFKNFIEITKKSKFSLAPRGNIRSSFRFYEILQLGSIPVYVSDQFFTPFDDEIDWNDFCILIKENDIDNLEIILNNISDEQYNKMLENGKYIYKKYFTINSVCNKILNIL